MRTDSALKTPAEFRNIVVKQGDGYLVRLGEVARVELGPEDMRSELRVNGNNGVGLGIVKQSKANTLDVANGIAEGVERLRGGLPEGMTLDVSYDQSIFIRQSIKEVFIAIGIALSLVVAVIFVFLRSLRATLIPALAIPVSVIASFMVLATLGYSINVLTLLAFVLAIGLVVDDAIVVLENIHRRLESGEPPLLAAARGARQIAFAVIATTVVLVAVFVPISFMEGNTGRLFREFGVAVAAAVIFSSFVALSLTPMMCSKLLRPAREEALLYRLTEPGFALMHRVYRALVVRCLNMPIVVLATGVAVSGLAYELFRELPREFAPVEDRGVIFIPISGPEGASLGIHPALRARHRGHATAAARPWRRGSNLHDSSAVVWPPRPGQLRVLARSTQGLVGTRGQPARNRRGDISETCACAWRARLRHQPGELGPALLQRADPDGDRRADL